MPFLLSLIALHVLVSLVGFSQPKFFNRFIFRVGAFWSDKQWERLITSGLLHVDAQHLFFNMFSLYLFGKVFLENHPVSAFLIIYTSSLVSGNLLSLLIHKNHQYYKAAGASGGVSGLVFSTILLHPDMELAFIFIPFFFPGWVFALGFLLYTFYGMMRGKDQIGHDAHLGGALAGSLMTLVFFPVQVMKEPWFLLLALGLPMGFLFARHWFGKSHPQ
jgi:membrane associated rhomboid family serine protease